MKNKIKMATAEKSGSFLKNIKIKIKEEEKTSSNGQIKFNKSGDEQKEKDILFNKN